MPIGDEIFEVMLARAVLLRGSVNALGNADYSGVMATVNGTLRDRWHFPAPPTAHKVLTNELTGLLTNPRLSSAQEVSLQRAFRGT